MIEKESADVTSSPAERRYGAIKPTNPQPRLDATRAAPARPWRRSRDENATVVTEPPATPSAAVPSSATTGPSATTASSVTTSRRGEGARLETTVTPSRSVAARPGVAEPEGAVPDAGSERQSPRPGAVSDAPLVRARTPRPRSGWQALAYRATSGRWNPGPGERERREREREQQIAAQLKGRHVTAFFCLKGGISKTSTTAATSLALADLRPDPVFAIDANPDAGDLAERLVGDKLSGIAALARDIDGIDSLEALSRYTATRGRLTVLPGEPNPMLGDSLSAEDFDAVMRVVQQYYSFVQVDCGTGVTHPLMSGVLRFADTVVIPAAWSVTGARRAAETIDWLSDNGFERLAQRCIVVLTAKDIVSGAVDKQAVLDFLSRAADVIVVPADPHVADGTLLEWEALQSATREAYLDIAAAITRRFDDRSA